MHVVRASTKRIFMQRRYVFKAMESFGVIPEDETTMRQYTNY